MPFPIIRMGNLGVVIEGMNMVIKGLKCPHCGASLRIREGQRHVKCQYCDSELFLSGEDISGRSGTASQEDDTRPSEDGGQADGSAVRKELMSKTG